MYGYALCCQDEQGEEEQHKAVDVGKARVGESKEMPKEDGGVNHQQRVECPEILRLEAKEDDDAQPVKNEGVIDDAGACLVQILVVDEIYRSCDEENHHKGKEEHIVQGQLGVIAPMEVDDLLKVRPIVWEVVS